jgi:uncharacterized protein YraI
VAVELPTETATAVVTRASLTPTATQTRLFTPSPTLGSPVIIEPQLRVTLNSANVRSGPGTNYPVIGILREGSVVRVLARNSDSSWYNVELEEGQTAWLAAATAVGVNPSALESVPVAATIPVPPTATPSPTFTPSPTSTPPPPDTPRPPNTPKPPDTPEPTITLEPTVTPDPYPAPDPSPTALPPTIDPNE